MKRKPLTRKSSKPTIPSLHVKRSAELWLDVFEQAVFVYLENGETRQTHLHVVELAHDLADKVVDAFEQRWPGVKL